MKRVGLIAFSLMFGCAVFGRAETALQQLQKIAPEGMALEAAPLPDALPALAQQGSRQSDAYVGESKTQTITRRAGETEFSARMEIPIYRVWTELTLGTVSYQELVCDTAPGEGKGNWYGFFNAPSYEKADRLADAISGIGPGTAQCVVNSGAFSSKPRTWSDFKSRMRIAEESCGNGLYYKAVVQYGQTNAKNLGYAGEEDCHMETRTELVLKPVERREYSRTVNVDFRLQIEKAPLLPSESETFDLICDGFKAVVQANSRFNRYQIEKSGDADFVLTGERGRVKPNNSLAVGVAPTANKDVLLSIADMDFQPGLDNPQAQTIAVLSVRVPRFLRDKEIGLIRVPLVNGKAEATLNQYVGSALPSGKEYRIEYRLSRMNSSFNNTSESSTSETAKFTR